MSDTAEQVTTTSTVHGPDGQRYEITITADAEVIRGPRSLGRFLDLRDEIGRDHVPGELNDVLDRLITKGPMPA